MRVNILASTPEPLNVLFGAAKVCRARHITEGIIRNSPHSEKESLLRNVIESGHYSILEHVSMTFLITGLSRAASHQLVRHRIASYAQQSQRATEARDFIKPGFRSTRANEAFDNALNAIKDATEQLEALGIPQEDIRMLYPNATQTNIVMTMNLRSLMHFWNLRLCQRAQWEIRRLAVQMRAEAASTLGSAGFLMDYVGAPCQLDGCKEKEPCGFFNS